MEVLGDMLFEHVLFTWELDSTGYFMGIHPDLFLERLDDVLSKQVLS